MTTLTMRAAGALLLLSSVSACDAFAHAKYEKTPWGTAAADAPADFVAPSCKAPRGNTSSGGAEGALCSSANDCAPVCCECESGSEWLAASCVQGRCAGGGVACGRTGSCSSGASGGGVVVIGGGGGGSGADGGSSSGTAGGCGLTYDDASCDACMRTSCCQVEAACASDPICSGGGVDACVAGCADDACAAACERAYGSNRAAENLDACLFASCADACK